MIRNYVDGLFPEKINRGTLAEIPQICIDAFCEYKKRNISNDDGSSSDESTTTVVEIKADQGPGREDSGVSSGEDDDNDEFSCLKGNKSVSWNINRAFFLTHYDDAVLADVLSTSFLTMLLEAPDESVRLYMHELTYEFLLYWTRKDDDNFDQVFCLLLQLRQKYKIIFLEINSPIKLIFPKADTCFSTQKNISKATAIANAKSDLILEVTAISASHNVGSIMLLIEKIFDEASLTLDSIPENEDELDKLLEEELRILYTGSCRVLLNDLTNCPSFYHKCGAKKIITSLYIDTTYCMSHVEELPSRKAVENELVNLLREKVLLKGYEEPYSPFIQQQQQNESSHPCHVEIWTPNTHAGAMNFMKTVYNAFGSWTHVPKRLAIFLEQIPNFESYWKFTTVDPILKDLKASSNKNIFHQRPQREPPISFHYCCKTMEYLETCPKINHINRINVSLQCNMFSTPIGPTEDETKLNDESTSVYFKEPDTYRGIYSIHLSKFEMARFINFCEIDFDKVKPLFRPRYMNMQQLRDQMKQACKDVKECQPTDFDEDYPSQVFDFTGETRRLQTPTIRKKGKAKGISNKSATSLTLYSRNSRIREFFHYTDTDIFGTRNRFDPLADNINKFIGHAGQGDSAIPIHQQLNQVVSPRSLQEIQQQQEQQWRQRIGKIRRHNNNNNVVVQQSIDIVVTGVNNNNNNNANAGACVFDQELEKKCTRSSR